MKCTVRRVNINLTQKEENYLEFIKHKYMNIYGKTAEAEIFRDALEELARKTGYFSKNGK